MSPKNIANTSALLPDFIEVGKHAMGKEGRDGNERWTQGRGQTGQCQPWSCFKVGGTVLSLKPLHCPQQSWLQKSFPKVHLERSLKGLWGETQLSLALSRLTSSCLCQQPPMPLWLQGETQRSTTDTLALDFVLPSYQRTPFEWHLQRGSADTIDSAPQACGLKSETELCKQDLTAPACSSGAFY